MVMIKSCAVEPHYGDILTFCRSGHRHVSYVSANTNYTGSQWSSDDIFDQRIVWLGRDFV